MGLHALAGLHLLILVSCLCLRATGDAGGLVSFVDGSGRYIRSDQHGGARKIHAMTPSEIASTMSVLLGFAPSSSLSAESSTKLNEVLLPNPFDKPRAVFVIEVTGTEAIYPNLGSNFTSKVLGSDIAEIELQDEEEISVVSIDEPFGDMASIDREFADLAHLLGGSYVGNMESMDGELSFVLASGSSLKLRVSQQIELSFALNLAALHRGIKKAVEMHEDFIGSTRNPAELLKGTFTSVEALKEYGSDAAEKGLELFQSTLSSLFTLLQEKYKGEIVGVLLLSNEVPFPIRSKFNLIYPTRASRSLEEVGAIPAVLLVRRSLAWITGIILLVATLIGVYLLVNMPLTRDTLLYSNVKID